MLIEQTEHYMQEALRQAELAKSIAEVPIGAVVVYDNQIVGRGHNQVERDCDATAHAELIAIREAAKAIGNWRLNEAALFVTLEPCSMCIGGLLLSRVSKLFFGCFDPRQGAVGSVFNLSQHPDLPHQIEVYPEVLKAECTALLAEFFKNLRKS